MGCDIGYIESQNVEEIFSMKMNFGRHSRTICSSNGERTLGENPSTAVFRRERECCYGHELLETLDEEVYYDGICTF